MFEDLEHISSFDWSGFVLRWLLDGVKSFNKGKKDGQKGSATLGGCMFYLVVSVPYMMCIVLFVCLFVGDPSVFTFLFLLLNLTK